MQLPNEVLHLPVLKEFAEDNLLVSKVPVRLLITGTGKGAIIKPKTTNLTGNIKSKNSTGTDIKHGDSPIQDKDGSAFLLSNFITNINNFQHKTEHEHKPQYEKNKHTKTNLDNEANTLKVNLLQDDSLIAKEDLKLDKLLHIVSNKHLRNNKTHVYLNNSNNSDSDIDTPYIVDVRLLNRILKSIKSWFDKPMYLVN